MTTPSPAAALVPARRRGRTAGLGVPALIFFACAAYLGFANGPRFVDNAFFAAVYGLFSAGFVTVPLLAWRGGGAPYRDPGLIRSAWFPWLFTLVQGVAYSWTRGGHDVIGLVLGWGAFSAAGLVAVYLLGQTLHPEAGPTAAMSVAADAEKPAV